MRRSEGSDGSGLSSKSPSFFVIPPALRAALLAGPAKVGGDQRAGRLAAVAGRRGGGVAGQAAALDGTGAAAVVLAADRRLHGPQHIGAMAVQMVLVMPVVHVDTPVL